MLKDRLRNARWRLKRELRLREERCARDAPVRPASRRHGLPGMLIVSLTSYPPRYSTLMPTLKRLLSQSVGADHTILWIAPDNIDALPEDVKLLERDGLEIKITHDLGPHKKYFGARQAFPEAFIMTVDDDVAYPRHMTAELIRQYQPGEKSVIARRARRIAFAKTSEGFELKPERYRDWPIVFGGGELSDNLVPTGVGGVLYPPGAISREALDPTAIQRLCFYADDFWLFWMTRRAGYTTRMVRKRSEDREWHNAYEVGLWQTNQVDNDDIWRALYQELGPPKRLD